MNLLLHLVAVHAGNAPRFVRAALPEHVRAARVAIHANGVLLGNRVLRILAEADGDSFFATAGLHVGAARTMARFAAPGFFGSMRIAQHHFAHHGVLESAILIVMASDAGFAADVVAVGPLGRKCLGLFLRRRWRRSCGFRIRARFSLAGRRRILRWLLAGKRIHRREEK